MTNPYLNRPEVTFWKTAVAIKEWSEIYPISTRNPFMKRDMKIATAGSCFAQKVSSYIKSNKSINFLELETISAGQPVFSARYGNIYTARQLLELIVEAESGVPENSCAVQREDGRFVDVFRPFVEEDGYESAEEVIDSRLGHLAKVRQLFRDSDVFVFTLGLTEAWMSENVNRTYPVCPGIYTKDADSVFRNFSFNEVLKDLNASIELMKAINKKLNIIVTVSPVPLTATYTNEHVMSATSYSKSVLRSVCGEVSEKYPDVHYFPSYEIVVNPYRNGNAFEENKRSVRQEVVDVVMKTFEYSFLDTDIHTFHRAVSGNASNPVIVTDMDDDPICDDVQIEKSIGF